ncbi:MAG TPA: ThuA domain-containing protein [Acidobacteriaceae bacterium]|nr:ThuA domain-containing protein [Acidobacteriaceae bacterium]
MRWSRYALLSLVLCAVAAAGYGQQKRFSVLAFYSTDVEKDHVMFAQEAMQFYAKLGQRDGFDFAMTSNWDDLNAARLKDVQVVLWLDDFPRTPAQQAGFEQYMKGGGGWLGFHIAAYNDEGTHWPWFVDFLGGTVFYGNNWPPLPALIDVDDKSSPITRHLPAQFTSPINEWYIWKPSPRLNKDVKVLLTLDKSNYPIGLKDVIRGGDVPVMWTNTRYRMLYLNMGHGDKIFTNKPQNQLFEDALLWLGRRP